MDGLIDILMDNGRKLSYFLYNDQQQNFEHNKNWNFEIWKLNRPKKQILTTSTHNAYSGSVNLYQLQGENELQLLRKVNFNQE